MQYYPSCKYLVTVHLITIFRKLMCARHCATYSMDGISMAPMRCCQAHLYEVE